MAGQEPLTELHYFGIPMAYLDLFPKGIPVVIRTVVGTSQFCILHPDVADLYVSRITDNLFVLYVYKDSAVSPEAIRDLEVMLMQEGQSKVPVVVVRNIEMDGAFGESSLQLEEMVAAQAQAASQEDMEAQSTQHAAALVEAEIEVEIG
jgi:hypothetical protein